MIDYNLLTRKEAADFLSALGFRIAPATLAKLACIGGGPPMVFFGRRPLYARGELQDWAERRSLRRTSTSDAGVALSAAGGDQ